ncbi:MAG: membrane protein insertase YidC [Alphaproteobacteria bacterium]|nr:membrane protein insertase YidC [Alphaproteobacteria bacterium]
MMHNNMQPQGQMHPDDKRNLIIFFVACAIAFFAYDTFIHKPQMAALAARQQAEMAATAQAPLNGDAAAQVTIAEALAASPRVVIDNPDLSGSIALKGGRIDNLSLKQYFETVEKKTPVTLLAPARTEHPLYADYGWLGSNVAVPDANTEWRVKEGKTLSKDSPVTLTWSNGRGLTFERTYAVDGEYMFTVTQTVTNRTGEAVTLHPYASLTRQNLPSDYMKNAVMHEGPIGYFEDGLQEVSYPDLNKKTRFDYSAGKGWAGFTDKYWFSGIVADTTANYRFLRAGTDEKPIYQVDMTGAPITVAAGASASSTIRSYIGPKKLDVLNGYKDKGIERFDLVIDFGKFWFLTIPFFHILTWLGHSIGSFAPAILIFTVLVRLCVFPLANKSYRSFARMRKIQPKMLEIREKYGEDRAKLQQAIFELYKKEDVNPMAGCLPLLIQIPIFFSLYKTLYITLEMRHAPFWGWIQDMSAPDPYSVFTLFGLIDWTPPTMLQIGPWPIIMGFTMFLLQRMNPPAQDAVQAKVIAFMPVFITLLMAHMPAGLVIYWSWSNCLSTLQQYVLMRKEGVEVSFFRKTALEKKMEDAVSHGPAVHPAAEEIAQDLDAIDGEVVEKTISPPKKGGKKGKR